MEEAEAEECDVSSEDGELDRRTAEVRRAASQVEMPEGPTSFDTAEADFWRRWKMPVGSVLTYAAGGILENAEGLVAVLVEKEDADKYGIWLQVKPVGCENE
jgi:hypothetical protein